jgi:DNA-binding CsgD family transcriptional regulator
MDLVIDNKSNAEIGEHIFVSAETVKSHRKNIYRKMGVNNVLDLYKLLISKGYVEIN